MDGRLIYVRLEKMEAETIQNHLKKNSTNSRIDSRGIKRKRTPPKEDVGFIGFSPPPKDELDYFKDILVGYRKNMNEKLDNFNFIDRISIKQNVTNDVCKIEENNCPPTEISIKVENLETSSNQDEILKNEESTVEDFEKDNLNDEHLINEITADTSEIKTEEFSSKINDDNSRIDKTFKHDDDNEFKFRCMKCLNAAFTTNDAYNSHLNICEKNCDVQKLRKSTITRKIYLCSPCGSYFELWKLFLHMRQNHNKYICLQCLQLYSTIEQLSMHLTSMHNIELASYNAPEHFKNTLQNQAILLTCFKCEKSFDETDTFINHTCQKLSPPISQLNNLDTGQKLPPGQKIITNITSPSYPNSANSSPTRSRSKNIKLKSKKIPTFHITGDSPRTASKNEVYDDSLSNNSFSSSDISFSHCSDKFSFSKKLNKPVENTVKLINNVDNRFSLYDKKLLDCNLVESNQICDLNEKLTLKIDLNKCITTTPAKATTKVKKFKRNNKNEEFMNKYKILTNLLNNDKRQDENKKSTVMMIDQKKSIIRNNPNSLSFDCKKFDNQKSSIDRIINSKKLLDNLIDQSINNNDTTNNTFRKRQIVNDNSSLFDNQKLTNDIKSSIDDDCKDDLSEKSLVINLDEDNWNEKRKKEGYFDENSKESYWNNKKSSFKNDVDVNDDKHYLNNHEHSSVNENGEISKEVDNNLDETQNYLNYQNSFDESNGGDKTVLKLDTSCLENKISDKLLNEIDVFKENGEKNLIENHLEKTNNESSVVKDDNQKESMNDIILNGTYKESLANNYYSEHNGEEENSSLSQDNSRDEENSMSHENVDYSISQDNNLENSIFQSNNDEHSQQNHEKNCKIQTNEEYSKELSQENNVVNVQFQNGDTKATTLNGDIETRRVPKVTLKIPKFNETYVSSDNDSDDSMKLTMVEQENNNEKQTVGEEKKVSGGGDSLTMADLNIPVIELGERQPLEKQNPKELLKDFVHKTYSTCVYCNHARKIAVNAKQLSLHMIAMHRFSAIASSITAEELLPETFVKYLKDNLETLSSIYINMETYDSTNVEAMRPFDGYYECFQCRIITPEYKAACFHNRQKHQKFILICIMCKNPFYSQSELLCHLCPGEYIADCDIKFRCCFCSVDVLPSAFRLMVHLRKRHQVCDVCLEICRSQSSLSLHVCKHKLSHFCYRCNIAYRNKPDITDHLFWKHGTQSVVCKKCLQKKWPHIYHFCIPPALFVCDECNLSFTKAVALKVHKRIHSNNLPYSCTEDDCVEKFASKRLLEKHINAHREPPPAECIDPPSLEKEIEENKLSCDNQLEKNETISSENNEMVNKKATEEKSKQIVDVYDLPELNLSESDSDDENGEKKTIVSVENNLETSEHILKDLFENVENNCNISEQEVVSNDDKISESNDKESKENKIENKLAEDIIETIDMEIDDMGTVNETNEIKSSLVDEKSQLEIIEKIKDLDKSTDQTSLESCIEKNQEENEDINKKVDEEIKEISEQIKETSEVNIETSEENTKTSKETIKENEINVEVKETKDDKIIKNIDKVEKNNKGVKENINDTQEEKPNSESNEETKNEKNEDFDQSKLADNKSDESQSLIKPNESAEHKEITVQTSTNESANELESLKEKSDELINSKIVGKKIQVVIEKRGGSMVLLKKLPGDLSGLKVCPIEIKKASNLVLVKDLKLENELLPRKSICDGGEEIQNDVKNVENYKKEEFDKNFKIDVKMEEKIKSEEIKADIKEEQDIKKIEENNENSSEETKKDVEEPKKYFEEILKETKKDVIEIVETKKDFEEIVEETKKDVKEIVETKKDFEEIVEETKKEVEEIVKETKKDVEETKIDIEEIVEDKEKKVENNLIIEESTEKTLEQNDAEKPKKDKNDSSDSDSSSCSCGSNCSCSSSSSGSSSSSSSSDSDSDSNASENHQKQHRKNRKSKNNPTRQKKISETVDVVTEDPNPTKLPQPIMPITIYESDLYTEESETDDEDFYDEHPLKLALQDWKKLQAENNNQQVVEQQPEKIANVVQNNNEIPPTPYYTKGKKSRKRKKVEKKINKIKPLTIKYNSTNVPYTVTKTLDNSLLQQHNAQNKSSFSSKSRVPGSGSETDGSGIRSSKRRRVPNKFYGYSSDEDSSTIMSPGPRPTMINNILIKPQEPPQLNWDKDDLPSSPPPKSRPSLKIILPNRQSSQFDKSISSQYHISAMEQIPTVPSNFGLNEKPIVEPIWSKVLQERQYINLSNEKATSSDSDDSDDNRLQINHTEEHQQQMVKKPRSKVVRKRMSQPSEIVHNSPLLHKQLSQRPVSSYATPPIYIQKRTNVASVQKPATMSSSSYYKQNQFAVSPASYQQPIVQKRIIPPPAYPNMMNIDKRLINSNQAYLNEQYYEQQRLSLDQGFANDQRFDHKFNNQFMNDQRLDQRVFNDQLRINHEQKLIQRVQHQQMIVANTSSYLAQQTSTFQHPLSTRNLPQQVPPIIAPFQPLSSLIPPGGEIRLGASQYSSPEISTLRGSQSQDNVAQLQNQQQTNKSLYCYCQCPYDEVSEMIACDGKNCKIEWFHFECVGIMVPPKGEWFCPDCRKNQLPPSAMPSRPEYFKT